MVHVRFAFVHTHEGVVDDELSAASRPYITLLQEAQLPQGDRATRMLAYSCYVSRGIWVLERFQTAKVTFKVIQGHSFAMVPLDRPYTIS